MKLNINTKDKSIETTNILSLGIKIRAKIEETNAIKKGKIFCRFLYCSIHNTTKSAVKENSKPSILNLILVPIIAPKVEPISQYNWLKKSRKK